jgi:Domain of unknown function (DUF5069)
MITTVPDLSKSPPRSGRSLLGHYAWLARLADKIRAEQAGTNGDYTGYCPMSKGFLERAGVSQEAFDVLIGQGADDEKLVTYFDRHVSPERRQQANAFVLDEHRGDLDQQDQEEGRL